MWGILKQMPFCENREPALIDSESKRFKLFLPAVMNVAYAALSEVIKAWATEGHSVAVYPAGVLRSSPPLTKSDRTESRCR